MKKPSLNEYFRLGAYLRIIKSYIPGAYVMCDQVLGKDMAYKFERINGFINEICNFAEKMMFDDYPETNGGGFNKVFYGDIKSRPLNDIDFEIHKIAKRIMDLDGGNDHE